MCVYPSNFFSTSITTIPYFKTIRIRLLKKVSQSITDIYLPFAPHVYGPSLMDHHSLLAYGDCSVWIQSRCHHLILQWPIFLCSTADRLLKNKFTDSKGNPGKEVNVIVTTGQLFQSTIILA